MELEPHMSNVSAARRFVRDQVGAQAPEEALNDLMLMTSELVTNAFEHGAPGPVLVRVEVDHGGASLAVTSRGDHAQVPAVDDWRTAGADRISGRGLGIVRQIADGIDVERSDDVVTITVRRSFAVAER
jgi:anti-sigma regulatory factor (Ser/Thr protein kinase)